MSLPTNPQGRAETYLAKAAGVDVEIPTNPVGRVEEYLQAIAINGGGGGSEVEIAQQLADHTYEGRDLTVVFANEIANYTDEWAWVHARCDAGNFTGIHVGDYIPIHVAENTTDDVAAEDHEAQIVGIGVYGAKKIDWVTKNCYSKKMGWHSNDNNNGDATHDVPFAASDIYAWLESTIYPLLDQKLKNVITSKTVYIGKRYKSGSTLTDDNGNSSITFSHLWIPFACEVVGTNGFSTPGYETRGCIQYPLFSWGRDYRRKKRAGSGSDWWTASVASGDSTKSVRIESYGQASTYANSYIAGIPICFSTI